MDLRRAQRAYIQSVCDKKGWSYTDLAREAGLSSTTITRPMNNKGWRGHIRATTLRKIVAVSGMPAPAELKLGEPAAQPAPAPVLPYDEAFIRQVVRETVAVTRDLRQDFTPNQISEIAATAYGLLYGQQIQPAIVRTKIADLARMVLATSEK